MCEESLGSLFVCASQWKQKAPREIDSLGASVCLRTTFSYVNCNMCCENLSKLCDTILEAPLYRWATGNGYLRGPDSLSGIGCKYPIYVFGVEKIRFL